MSDAAQTHDWNCNLMAKTQAKADAKVSAAMVSAEVSGRKALTEAVRVEVEAEIQARIRIDHRKDIGRARGLTGSEPIPGGEDRGDIVDSDATKPADRNPIAPTAGDDDRPSPTSAQGSGAASAASRAYARCHTDDPGADAYLATGMTPHVSS